MSRVTRYHRPTLTAELLTAQAEGHEAIVEIPKNGVTPALAGVILDATGVAIDQIPFTPERVWNAITGS